ncbi:hypothetical protein Kpol_392p5 [Vanderwaltozyma polyspora DSM 70294]|uniref:Glutamate pyruvate transaminase n=1 Tax=Vanderwaltozyma polyspora (strain ATCC 22028 / DSM 70294 / BCRC 21397 / CBS 2163 / NBRC 10782 / NRRL Y-8283 / UCD 57-17) TaxID=436907 RepID=A7TRR6_VANPO|nr:uncharacterized protein Kpol_392p5 [Vanderwaltozyma polyspora DSM 70294]EDO15038.1 hypothetical protein Kpol_392p5 [Vanderwaltozyma polyspora DSM 70294]
MLRSGNCSISLVRRVGVRRLTLSTTLYEHKHNVYPAQKLRMDDLNKNVLKAKYAVRGSIPLRAEELKLYLEAGQKLPFDTVINANIGNPQQLKQKPLTFYRQVLSILQYPELLESGSNIFKKDAIERARKLLKEIGSVGSYSSSQGIPAIRKTVANFITKRDDGEISTPNDIFLTAGASSAVDYLLSILCKNEKSGVLIPIPQYPLYTATLALNNAHALPYYLDESKGWSTDINEIEEVINDSLDKGIKPTALVIINPGNPTGSILSVESMEKIIEVAATHGIVIIADEVYQENVFNNAKFHSMKKVLRNLQKAFPGEYDTVQLASLHSTSKGVSGECGQRGGYMELTGFNPEIKQVILKLCSISLCPVVTGQALVDLMVSPPQKGDESYEQDQLERSTILNDLSNRAILLWEAFNSMEGVSCQKPEGAMYLFPKIDLPFKVLQKSQELDITPDEFYCKALLEATGICTVPGSGFGQQPGTYHLRTTFLAPGTEWIDRWNKFHAEFYDKYRD